MFLGDPPGSENKDFIIHSNNSRKNNNIFMHGFHSKFSRIIQRGQGLMDNTGGELSLEIPKLKMDSLPFALEADFDSIFEGYSLF